MHLSSYLENIELGKPINFRPFLNQLEAAGYERKKIITAFQIEKIGRSKDQVSIIDADFFATLQANYPAGFVTDRPSAAEAGDSHRQPASHAIVVLYPDRQSHPIVILNNREGMHTPVTLSRRLLIIENLENFARKEETLAFLKREFSGFNDASLDIALGAGNSISNRLNAPFLAHYEQIDCLFDLDMGGLQTFANLVELTHHAHLHFLLPPSAELLMKKANSERKKRWSLQKEQLPKLRELHHRHPQLRATIEQLIKHKMMLEQELYLQE